MQIKDQKHPTFKSIDHIYPTSRGGKNTPINKVFPEYTKATQELKALKAEKEANLNPAPTPIASNTGLTDQQKSEAKQLLKDLGFVSREEAQQEVEARFAARELLQDVSGVLNQAKENGNPATTPQELLNHMQETGIKNPQKAYKDMFETELDAIKEKKLSTIKSNGMVTTEASTAGSKQPATVKVTKQNLGQVVAEALGGLN